MRSKGTTKFVHEHGDLGCEFCAAHPILNLLPEQHRASFDAQMEATKAFQATNPPEALPAGRLCKPVRHYPDRSASRHTPGPNED
jgi:hypothetical protein